MDDEPTVRITPDVKRDAEVESGQRVLDALRDQLVAVARRSWRDGHALGWLSAHERVLLWLRAGLTLDQVRERLERTLAVGELTLAAHQPAGRDPTSDQATSWRVGYRGKDGELHIIVVDTYEDMREAVNAYSREIWIAAGEPLDPAWQEAPAREDLWRHAGPHPDTRVVDHPDGSTVRIDVIDAPEASADSGSRG